MMDRRSRDDVPSPIDLRKMADARNWASSATEKRPWREEFFHVIVQEIKGLSAGDPSLLELGSGPGFLASHILGVVPSAKYVALDFSSAMHVLARERLGTLSERVQFLELSFKEPHWNSGLPIFDAVVAVQAVHELRHKRHAPWLYRAIRPLLGSKGAFLMCDHFVGEGGMSDTALYMTPEEHELALAASGFSQVRTLLRKSGLILFQASVSDIA